MSVSNLVRINHKNGTLVLIPTSAATLLSTKLAVSNQQDLESALPYALEDKLVQNVEDLHFAWVKETGQDDIHVVVIENDLMQSLHEQYSEPNVVALPDVLSLPIADKRWCVVIHGDRALVRTSTYEGFECPKQMLAQQLKLVLRDNVPPKKIHYWYQTEQDKQWLPKNVKPLVQFFNFDNFRNWITKNAMPAYRLNLFSGSYEIKKDHDFNLAQWIPAIALVLISLVIHFGYSWYQIISYEKKANDLTDQSHQLFKQSFPQVKRIVRPRVQAEQELKKLRLQNAGTDNYFFSVYGHVLKQSSAFPDMRLLGFSWKNNRFDYQIEAGSMTSIETLNRNLSQLGLNSEVANFVNDKGKTKSKLLIKVN